MWGNQVKADLDLSWPVSQLSELIIKRKGWLWNRGSLTQRTFGYHILKPKQLATLIIELWYVMDEQFLLLKFVWGRIYIFGKGLLNQTPSPAQPPVPMYGNTLNIKSKFKSIMFLNIFCSFFDYYFDVFRWRVSDTLFIVKEGLLIMQFRKNFKKRNLNTTKSWSLGLIVKTRKSKHLNNEGIPLEASRLCNRNAFCQNKIKN